MTTSNKYFTLFPSTNLAYKNRSHSPQGQFLSVWSMLSPSGRTTSKSGPSAAQLLAATTALVTLSSPTSPYLMTRPFTLSYFHLLPFYHFLIAAHPACRAETMSFRSVYASSRQPTGLLRAHEAGAPERRHWTRLPRLIPAGSFPSPPHPPAGTGLLMALAS